LRGRFAKLRRDVRALSPIFAVLLLIAIAVIAGIIIYMYTTGYLSTMMGGGTAGQEKVAVEAVQVISTTAVTIWAKSTGGGPVVISEVILRDASGNTVDVDIAPTGTPSLTLPANGAIVSISATFTAMTSGETYTVALVSQAGSQFVSGGFKAP